MPSTSVYDHLRPTDSEAPDGIYRVVGTDAEAVTLLRVGDADDRRINTGEVHRVARDDLDGFESAANPDGNRSLGSRVMGVPEHLYWSVRAFGAQVRANPLAAAVAFTAFLLGSAGDAYVSAPPVVFDVLLIAGIVGIALVGNGRL